MDCCESFLLLLLLMMIVTVMLRSKATAQLLACVLACMLAPAFFCASMIMTLLSFHLPRLSVHISDLSDSRIFMALFFVAAMLDLELSSGNTDGSGLPFSHIWSLGFGSVSSETVIGSFNYSGPTGLVGTVFMANLPQLVLTFFYLIYNGIFTCMLLTKEWSSFTLKRKPLRVSSPQGIQRSTYRLQMPCRYGIPLLIGSGLLHWLVSQSIFLIRVNSRDSTGKQLPDKALSTCGYSPIALIFFTGLFVMLVGFTVMTGLFRKYEGGVPLAASYSVIISAACHAPEGTIINSTLQGVKWEMIIDERDGEADGRDNRKYSFTGK